MKDLKVCGLSEAGTQDRVSWRSSVKNSRQEPTPSNRSAPQSMAAPPARRVLGICTRSFNKTGFDWLIDWLIQNYFFKILFKFPRGQLVKGTNLVRRPHSHAPRSVEYWSWWSGNRSCYQRVELAPWQAWYALPPHVHGRRLRPRCHAPEPALRWNTLRDLPTWWVSNINTLRLLLNGCHFADNIWNIFSSMKKLKLQYKFQWNSFVRV